MRLKESAYIFLLPFLFLSACVADELGINETGPVYSTGDEEGLAFFVESNAPRTRSVNFSPGAMVKINSVWVGVFDLNDTNTKDGTYKCVKSSSIEQCFIELNSSSDDKKYTNLIRVDLGDAPAGTEDHQFLMMSVVNYNDVTDQYGVLLKERLDEDILTWQDFVDIAVDTKGAYTYPHDADSPMMAGFLRKNFGVEKNALHVQVDQFKNDKIFPETLLNMEADEGEKLPDGILPVTYDRDTKKYKTDGYAFRLRRLVANINVNIEPVNSYIEITNVSYRRHNMPEAVYIVERRTADFTQDENGVIKINEIPSERDHAANFADKVWYDYSKKSKTDQYLYTTGFTDDEEWQINSNRDSETGIWSFSFQHFANKHWARQNIEEYSQREKREYLESANNSEETPQYYFSNLANGIDDFNNKASFFELKLHLVDSRNNRCAEAIYVIHEGNTSNVDGVEMDGGNLNDFSVARNISYVYNIKVDGFENIFLNVEDDGTNQSYTHHPDQGGKVWQLIYMNDPQNKQRHYYVDPETGIGHFENVLKGSTSDAGKYNIPITTKDENGKEQTSNYIMFKDAMTFAPKPNLSFRLYGYTNYRTKYNKDELEKEGGISGYNYNFERSSFANLYGLWPPSASDYSHYFMDDISLDINEIPTDLRTGVMIQEAGNDYYMNMIEFVNHASIQSEEKTYNVFIAESNLTNGVIQDWPVTDDNKEKYVRAIYIADRNGVYDPVDKCSQLVNVYCIAQYPEYKGEKYEMVVAHHNNSAILPYNPDLIDPDKPRNPYLVDNNLSDITGLASTDLLHDGKGMVFTAVEPKLAFRLIGFDDNDNYVDYCYNFDITKEVYDKFKDEWPVYLNAIRYNNQSNLTNNDVPMTKLMEGLKIHLSDRSTMTVAQFVEAYMNQSLNGAYADGFYVDTYNHAGEMSAGIRRLYIFDKNIVEEKRLYDTNMNDYYHQIYGVSQYPYDNTVKVNFLVSARGNEYMISKWADEYNKNLSPEHKDDINYNIHYTTGSSNWTGTVNSIVYMPFTITIEDWIHHYDIEFKKGNIVAKTKTFTYEEMYNLKRSDDFIILEEKTDTWEDGTYDVIITPVPVNDGKLYSGFKPVTLSKQLVLETQSWDLTTDPWSSISNEKIKEEVELNFVDYKTSGTTAKNYSVERNFFFNYYGMELGIFSVKDNLFNNVTGGRDSKKYLASYADNPPYNALPANGPTDGKPFVLKFITLVPGKLEIDVTATNTTLGKELYVDVDGVTKLHVESMQGTTSSDSPAKLTVDSVKEGGSEIVIYAPVINGTARYYSVKFIPGLE